MARKALSIFESMQRKRGQYKPNLTKGARKWFLRFRMDSPDKFDPNTGKPLRERVTHAIADSSGPDAVTRKEAERIAWEEYLRPLDAATLRPSSGKLLADFVKVRFRPDVIETLKPSGKKHYEYLLSKHVLPLLGSEKLRDITVERVQGVLNLKGKTLSTQTVIHIRNCISAILRHAKAMQWYFGELPTTAVRLPAMQRKEVYALTWGQVCQLANVLPEPCATLVVFLAVTGLRIGEAMGLRWNRVNLTHEPVIVDMEVIPPMSLLVRENFVLGNYQTLKTGTSYRTVPIPEWFAPRLIAAIRTQGSGSVDGMAAVFANTSGVIPLDSHNLAARVLKPAAKALKMPWVSWHCLRRTNATLADQAGLTISERQKMLGHATPAMSLHYTIPEIQAVRGRVETMVNPKLLN